jgi:hypothetical protein
MTQNIIIAVLFALGVVMLIVAFRIDGKSSFDDGSFILQIVLGIGGAALLAVALIWKFVLSFF